ncbi:hypothetical protein K439DRAFT_1610593 [Ramaria rubella]|nr:hypothetical protein K439DRAFT_1610593 [Ramaria rubella]
MSGGVTEIETRSKKEEENTRHLSCTGLYSTTFTISHASVVGIRRFAGTAELYQEASDEDNHVGTSKSECENHERHHDWEHLDLQHFSQSSPTFSNEPIVPRDEAEELRNEKEDEDDEDLEEEGRRFFLTQGTFDEALDHCIDMIRDFIDALEYQRQFRDSRFLAQLEQRGASFFSLC